MTAKCGQCGTENPDWVPRARYNEVAKARDTAMERSQNLEGVQATKATEHQTALDELQGKLDALGDPASKLEALTAEHQGLQEKLAASQLRQDLMMGGIQDQEGLEVAATLWAALGEDKRPDTVEAWLADGAPRAVTVYVGSAGTSGGSGSSAEGGAGEGQEGTGTNGHQQAAGGTGGGFTPTGGKGSGNQGGGSLTPEQISAMGQAEFQEFLKNNPAGIR